MVSETPGGRATQERWESPPIGRASGGARAREVVAVMTPGRAAAWLRLLRPHHWTKNLACLAGVLFSGRFVEPGAVARALWTFAVFCAASSAVYALNDVFDRERDRRHPRKRTRPVASGTIGVATAVGIGMALAAGSLVGAAALGAGVLACLVLYVANNVAYSVALKHLALF